MSNGSSKLVSRHPDTFEILSELDVTLQGQPVFQINELECVGSQIYANIWKSDRIMVIDSTSGRVAAEIDASNLLSPEERNQLQPGRQVLNGIAYNREKDLFYLTGKEWSKLFEDRFVSP